MWHVNPRIVRRVRRVAKPFAPSAVSKIAVAPDSDLLTTAAAWIGDSLKENIK